MNITPTTLFAALANDIRLRCLILLVAHDELCVCELTHALGVAQPYVSRHLAQLREQGWVLDRRAGLWVHYRIHPGLPAWAQGVLRETAAGISGQSPFADDRENLAHMPNRPSVSHCA